MTVPQRSPVGDAAQPGRAGPPVHWPSLGADEATYEWDDLRAWVERFRERFPIVPSLPDCWWRHNHMVELLAALRDHERASFGRAAPGTAGMEWHHARGHAELQLEFWIRRLACGATGRGHPRLDGPVGVSEWDLHVQQDVDRRRASN